MTKKIVKVSSKPIKEAKKTITKKVVKTKPKVEENSILEDSFQVIQKLGKDVKAMAEAKNFLKEEINKLDQRLTKKEKAPVTDSFISKVRDEIIQDFEPIFKKINPNNIKNQIKDEIIKTIELETSKIKSEFSNLTTKNNRQLTQKLSSLESQILESLSTSKKIQTEFKKLQTSDMTKLKTELEDSIHISIGKLNKKYFDMLSTNNIDIEELKKSLTNQKTQLTKFQNLMKKDLTTDAVDLSAIEAKTNKLDKEYTIMSNSIKKIEIELKNINLKKQESQKGVDKEIRKIKTELDLFENKLLLIKNKVDKDSDADLVFRIDALNKDLSNQKIQLSKFKTEINNDFKINSTDLKTINLNISKLEKNNKELNSIIQNFEDNISTIKTQLDKETNADLVFRIDALNKDLSNQKSDIIKFKTEINSSLKVDANDLATINSKIGKLEQEHKAMNSLVQKFEDKLYEKTQTESTQIEKKVKELLIETENKFKEISNEKQESQKYISNEIKLIKIEIDNFEDKIKVIEAKSQEVISKDLATKVNELKKLVEAIEKKTTKSFEIIEKEKIAQKDFLVKEYNKVAKDLELLESKYEKLAKAELNVLKIELESMIKKDFDDFKKNISQFDGSRENEVKLVIKQLEKTNDVFLKDIQKKYEELNNLFITKITGTVKSYEKDKINWDSKITKFKLDLTKLAQSHFNKVDKQLKSVEGQSRQLTNDKKLILKELDDRIKKELKIFDDKLNEATVKVNSLMENLQEERRSESMYLKDRVNELIDKFNSLSLENEAKIVALEQKVMSNISSEIKVFDDKLNEATVRVSSLIENIEEEKRIESIFIKEKTNELIDKFNSLSLENEAHLAILANKASVDLENKLNITHKEVTEKLARDIVSNNEFLSKLKLENKEDKRALNEDIETKFVTAKLQFEESFNNHIASFDKNLKSKEKEFTDKIKDVYNEKEALIIEMTSFKDEVGILTKEYVTKLDEELQKLRNSEASFESEKDSFFTHIDNLVQAKKLELQDYGQSIEVQIYELLKNQKETFNKNENSFREVFNDKISTLREFTEKRLESIEKKFIDKNLKVVTQKIDSQLEYLSLFEQKLESKEEEIVKHLEILEDSKNMLHEEFIGEFNNLNSKVEQRLTQAEKQYNKRFIDYDSTITQFKSVVIDEVEGLIREINEVANNKIAAFDNTFEKVEVLAKGVSRNLEEIKNAKLILDKEFSGIRDELNDLRIGFEGATHLKLGTVNNLVQNMAEYENQLIDLVQSLKGKGVSNQNILNALINKGHPRMYVTMIINNLDQVLLK